MKTISLISLLSFLTTSAAFAAATVEMRVKKDGGELQVINNRTKAGFIERGGKNYGTVKYMAEPGTYTVTGKNPGCPPVVQSASFEEETPYTIVFTEDCKIQNFTL